MIHITMSTGSADRKAPVISDDLIPDEATANIRAQQELAKFNYIVMNRTLELPHDPTEGHGTVTSYFSFHPLGIFGRHAIISRSITLTPTSAMDSVTIEQYRRMDL